MTDQKALLLEFWGKLQSVTKLTFSATSHAKTGWNGTGRSEVVVTTPKPNMIHFQEKGSFQNLEGQSSDFFNTFRWILDQDLGSVSLEHLRFGSARPVYLFHLAPSKDGSLESVDSHLCNEDKYSGRVLLEENGFRFCWRVIGPKKNEEIDYYYF